MFNSRNWWWGQEDSNLRSLKTADLQSAHVGRLWNVPGFKKEKVKSKLKTCKRVLFLLFTFNFSFFQEPLAGVEPATY
jgi:hypothetical protein